MTHQEIIKTINQSDIPEDQGVRGMTLSNIDAIRDILISKNIVSEAEYNCFFDKSLLRNFKDVLESK